MMPTRRLVCVLPIYPLSMLPDGAHALLLPGGMKKLMLVTHVPPTKSTMPTLKPVSVLPGLPTSTQQDSASPVMLPQFGTHHLSLVLDALLTQASSSMPKPSSANALPMLLILTPATIVCLATSLEFGIPTPRNA